MNTQLIIKLNYLILGLGLILYAMYHLNTFGLNKNLTEFMGFNKAVKIERSVKAKR